MLQKRTSDAGQTETLDTSSSKARTPWYSEQQKADALLCGGMCHDVECIRIATANIDWLTATEMEDRAVIRTEEQQRINHVDTVKVIFF